ncbi:Uncharacterized protein APZ42_031718 [Daphnia magna]|uniref:Uncharacterized protein n=1 Tax=Daphnia magna TaxID=35525 RepID=A0A164MKY9_9CRUS|nr:Uncharacterized protein APZ42_031718 [Daphnia magna]
MKHGSIEWKPIVHGTYIHRNVETHVKPADYPSHLIYTTIRYCSSVFILSLYGTYVYK